MGILVLEWGMINNITSYCISIILLRRYKFLNEDNPSYYSLSFKEKYFLIRLLYVYGVDIPVVAMTSRLVQLLSISARDIKESRDSLLAKGCLDSYYLKVEGELRVRKGVRFNVKWLAELARTQPPQSPNAEFIAELFFFGERVFKHTPLDTKPLVERRFGNTGRHKLLASNRILLGVLLLSSDSYGFVTELGVADLQKLCGMGIDKTKSQILKLMELGYIRSRIPGDTFATAFGRVNGIYTLNLSHPSFGSISGTRMNILCATNQVTHSNEKSEAEQIFEWARKVESPSLASQRGLKSSLAVIKGRNFTINAPLSESGKQVPILSGFLHLAGMFTNKALVRVLQFRIDAYVSAFLNSYWHQINEKDLLLFSDILERIRSDVSSALKKPEGLFDAHVYQYRYQQAGALIYEIAFFKAAVLKRVLVKYLDSVITLDQLNYSIMPHTNKDYSYGVQLLSLITVIPKDSSVALSSYVFLEKGDTEGLSIKSAPSMKFTVDSEDVQIGLYHELLEEQISDGLKYGCGLLTRPK